MEQRKRKKSKWPSRSVITPTGWSYLHRRYHLTPRELQTAIAVCRGCDNRQVAEKLEVELNTAKVYLAGVYKRVGVSSKSMLILTMQNEASKVKGGLDF
jgi:DNA-binding NarL/FixJ family response regulator